MKYFFTHMHIFIFVFVSVLAFTTYGSEAQESTVTLTDEMIRELKQQIKKEILAELQNGNLAAQQQESTDIAQLKQQIKAEILAELQNNDALYPLIEAGIKQYVKNQQQAQQKAREEQRRLAKEKAKNVRRVSTERDHIYGNPEAPISLIEYSDFECPFCKKFHPTPKQVVEAYNGQVNWVYRHYPLDFHNPLAQKESEASECAGELGGNDAFWKYTDLLYERTKSNGKGLPIESLGPMAEEIGLNQGEFQDCLDSGRYTERVQEDLREGASSGITGTPGSILLNNQTGSVNLVSGAVPVETLKKAIDQLLTQ